MSTRRSVRGSPSCQLLRPRDLTLSAVPIGPLVTVHPRRRYRWGGGGSAVRKGAGSFVGSALWTAVWLSSAPRSAICARKVSSAVWVSRSALSTRRKASSRSQGREVRAARVPVDRGGVGGVAAETGRSPPLVMSTTSVVVGQRGGRYEDLSAGHVAGCSPLALAVAVGDGDGSQHQGVEDQPCPEQKNDDRHRRDYLSRQLRRGFCRGAIWYRGPRARSRSTLRRRDRAPDVVAPLRGLSRLARLHTSANRGEGQWVR